ncbi:MAG: HprK-related kinase A [Magnetococcales bacterium]|nr:HprK-related kinase A [Magnetococcales bacterium]
MKIGDHSLEQLDGQLREAGLCWRTGPFILRLKADIPQLTPWLHTMYGEHPVVTEPEIIDFHLQMRRGRGLRRWWRPQVHFLLDGNILFAPFPLDHAPPLFEWGLNLCIAGRANHFLLLHTAVVAKGGRAMLLSGVPGSGKSTLCAALVVKGWRLLSDEFSLVHPDNGMVYPLARPAALKNQSIDLIRNLTTENLIGPAFPNTRKGTVAHLKPPAASVQAHEQPAQPAWVICPQYRPDRPAHLTPLAPDHALLRLGANAFNYETRGASGFHAIAALVNRCSVHHFFHDNLEEAVVALESLSTRDIQPSPSETSS